MEIKQYLEITKHWFWLILVGIVLGGLFAWGFSIIQEPVFQATARVQVMSAPQSGSTDYAYYNEQQLAQTYVQTIKSRLVLAEVETLLGVVVQNIKTQVVSNTQLIDIIVEDDDPQQAADIANLVVTVFSEQNGQLQASRFLESEQNLQAQIDQVDQQIAALQTQSSAVITEQTQATADRAQAEMQRLEGEILALQNEIETLRNPPRGNSFSTPTPSAEIRSQLNEKELKLNQLQSTYNLYQQIYTNLVVLGKDMVAGDPNSGQQNMQATLALYQEIRANLLSSYESIRLARMNSTSNIVPIEPAVANSAPIRPNVFTNTLLGIAVGLMLAAATVFAIEYLDDTLKTSDQITQVLGLPVIGYIAEMEHYKDIPYVSENPRSPVSETFRTLRTNLEFSSVDNPLKTLLLVSAHPAEGKTTVAANLAVTMAQGGKKVLLIDADLRRPRVHQFFGLSNRVGLSDLIRDSVSLPDVTRPWKDTSLSIITSGGIPPNPADLLSSDKMARILEAAKKAADMVIVDSPPFLVADASILASRMDGVLLLVYPGKTPIDAALTTLEQMKRAGARIVGVVMNRIPRNRSHYYSGYRYYSSHYQGHYDYFYMDEKPVGKMRRLPARLKKMFSGKKKSSEDVTDSTE
jgi:polysaccharide biosynthesis transport protein